MTRANTATKSKTTASKTKTTTTKASATKEYAVVRMAHGAGVEEIYFETEDKLNRFLNDVMKRNLTHYPLQLLDARNNLYIIRSFLFCKVTVKS